MHGEAAGEEGSESSSKRLRHSADIHASSATTYTLADVSQQGSDNFSSQGSNLHATSPCHIIITGAYYLAMMCGKGQVIVTYTAIHNRAQVRFCKHAHCERTIGIFFHDGRQLCTQPCLCRLGLHCPDYATRTRLAGSGLTGQIQHAQLAICIACLHFNGPTCCQTPALPCCVATVDSIQRTYAHTVLSDKELQLKMCCHRSWIFGCSTTSCPISCS